MTLPSHTEALARVVEVAYRLELLATSHGTGIHLDRSFTGPDDLRWSCGFNSPIDSSVLIYGWGKNSTLAYNEARARYEREQLLSIDLQRKAAIAAIRDRHEALIQEEIAALPPTSYT